MLGHFHVMRSFDLNSFKAAKKIVESFLDQFASMASAGNSWLAETKNKKKEKFVDEALQLFYVDSFIRL